LNPQESFTVYNLVKATGLRIPAVTEELRLLLGLGWIVEDTQRRFTSPSYRINLGNEVVRCISDFLWQLACDGGRRRTCRASRLKEDARGHAAQAPLNPQKQIYEKLYCTLREGYLTWVI